VQELPPAHRGQLLVGGARLIELLEFKFEYYSDRRWEEMNGRCLYTLLIIITGPEIILLNEAISNHRTRNLQMSGNPAT
jgi:hypothetical protein